MKTPQDPHDPRLNRAGNRLFRNAAQQRQRKPSFSWAKVAIAVTVLFTSAGAAFYYMGKGESPAPAPATVAAADPAPQTSATQAADAIPLITPAPVTPTPKPTPEPTPRAARKRAVAKASSSEGSSRSRSGTESSAKSKAKAKAKNKIDPPAKEVLTTGRRELVESNGGRASAPPRTSADSSAPSGVKSKSSAAAHETDSKPRASTKTASSTTKPAASKTKSTVSASTDNTPPEAQRPRFNMRPDSMRSASTERVNNLQEFPAAPGSVDSPAAAKKGTATKAKKKADGDSAAALPPVPQVTGREQSAAAAPAGKATVQVQDGLPGSVSQGATREEAAVAAPAPGSKPIPKVDLEDRSVEYPGPPEDRGAPGVIVKGVTRRPYPMPRQVYPYRQERMASQSLVDRNGMRIPPPPFNGGTPPGHPVAPPPGRVAPSRTSQRPAPAVPLPIQRTAPPASSSNAGNTVEFQDAQPGNFSEKSSSSGPVEKMAGQLSRIDGVEVQVVPE